MFQGTTFVEDIKEIHQLRYLHRIKSVSNRLFPERRSVLVTYSLHDPYAVEKNHKKILLVKLFGVNITAPHSQPYHVLQTMALWSHLVAHGT